MQLIKDANKYPFLKFTHLEVLGPVTFTEQFVRAIKSAEKNFGSCKLKA